MKTKIVWTAHYKGIVKIFPPQGSVNTFIQYTWHVHGISFKWKKKRRKRRNKPICKRRKRKSRSPSGRKMTDCTITKHFGLVLSHRERCWFVWQQQTMAQEAQKTWQRRSAVFQLRSLKCFIGVFFVCVFVFLRMCYCYQVFYFFKQSAGTLWPKSKCCIC